MHVSIHWAIEAAWCTPPKQAAVILPRDANGSVCVMNDSTNREIKRQIHIFVAHYFDGGVEHAMDSHAFHQSLFCLCTESQLHNINYNRNERKRNDRMDVCVSLCVPCSSKHSSLVCTRTNVYHATNTRQSISAVRMQKTLDDSDIVWQRLYSFLFGFEW